MNKDRNSQLDQFRPPLVSAVMASGAAYGSHYLYQLSQSGSEFAGPAAIAAGGVAAFQTIRAIDDFLKLRACKRKLKKFKEAGKQYGKDHFANLNDLRKATLIGNRNLGIYFGQFQGHDIRYWGENSGHIYSPTGGGKTSSVFITTLLSASARTARERKHAPSFFIYDQAAEAHAVTEKALRRAGYDVVVVSSWADDISETIGRKVVDAGLNIFSTHGVAPSADTLRDETKFRMFQLIPAEKPGTDEKTQFFNAGGRGLVECIALNEYAEGRIPDLVSLHEQVMAGPSELNAIFTNCMETSAFGGYLARLASGLAGIMNGAPEQFAGYQGVATKALELYDSESVVGRHVTGDGFDVRRFKGEKPVAVFFIYPGKRSHTHQRMLNMEISYTLEMICANPCRRRVIALIDETASLGYVPSLLRFLNQGRKYGLSLVCCWQSLTGQAEYNFGRSGMRQILEAGHFLWASGIREPEACEMLSKIAGTRSIIDVNFNDQAHAAHQMAGLNFGMSHKSLPLIGNVRTELASDEALIAIQNLPIIKARKVPYFRSRWKRLAGRNPYYER